MHANKWNNQSVLDGGTTDHPLNDTLLTWQGKDMLIAIQARSIDNGTCCVNSKTKAG